MRLVQLPVKNKCSTGLLLSPRADETVHGLSDAPRRLVWEVRVGVGGVDVESVPKVEPNFFFVVQSWT